METSSNSQFYSLALSLAMKFRGSIIFMHLPVDAGPIARRCLAALCRPSYSVAAHIARRLRATGPARNWQRSWSSGVSIAVAEVIPSRICYVPKRDVDGGSLRRFRSPPRQLFRVALWSAPNYAIVSTPSAHISWTQVDKSGSISRSYSYIVASINSIISSSRPIVHKPCFS